MSAPRAEATPARAATLATDAQAELVRRYARMLRSASASVAMTRGGSERRVETVTSRRFTGPMAAGRQTDDA
jgi:hypothetical protein